MLSVLSLLGVLSVCGFAVCLLCVRVLSVLSELSVCAKCHMRICAYVRTCVCVYTHCILDAVSPHLEKSPGDLRKMRSGHAHEFIKLSGVVGQP